MASNQGSYCLNCGYQLIPGDPICQWCGLHAVHNQGPNEHRHQRQQHQYGRNGPLPSPHWHNQHHQQQQPRYPYQPRQFVPDYQGFFMQQQQGGYYPYAGPSPLSPQQMQYLMGMNVRFPPPPQFVTGPQNQPFPQHPQQNVTITELSSLEYSDTHPSGHSHQTEQGTQVQQQNAVLHSQHQMNANSQDPGKEDAYQQMNVKHLHRNPNKQQQEQPQQHGQNQQEAHDEAQQDERMPQPVQGNRVQYQNADPGMADTNRQMRYLHRDPTKQQQEQPQQHGQNQQEAHGEAQQDERMQQPVQGTQVQHQNADPGMADTNRQMRRLHRDPTKQQQEPPHQEGQNQQEAHGEAQQDERMQQVQPQRDVFTQQHGQINPDKLQNQRRQIDHSEMGPESSEPEIVVIGDSRYSQQAEDEQVKYSTEENQQQNEAQLVTESTPHQSQCTKEQSETKTEKVGNPNQIEQEQQKEIPAQNQIQDLQKQQQQQYPLNESKQKNDYSQSDTPQSNDHTSDLKMNATAMQNNNVEEATNDLKAKESWQSKIHESSIQQDTTPGDIQEDNSDTVNKNQHIHMGLKQLQEKLSGQNNTENQSPHHGAVQVCQPEFKPVFGKQAQLDSRQMFAFESTARSKDILKSSESKPSSQPGYDPGKLPKTEAVSTEPEFKPVFGKQAQLDSRQMFAFESTARSKDILKSSESKPSSQPGYDPGKLPKTEAVSTEQTEGKDSKQNREVTSQTKPAAQNVGKTEDQDESPPIPLQSKDNQKAGNISAKGDGQTSQIRKSNQNGPGKAGNCDQTGQTVKKDSGAESSASTTGEEKSSQVGKSKQEVSGNSGGGVQTEKCEKEGHGPDSVKEPPGKAGDGSQTDKTMNASTTSDKSTEDRGPGSSAKTETSTGVKEDGKGGSSGDQSQETSGKDGKKKLADVAKGCTDQGSSGDTSQPKAYKKQDTKEEDYFSGTKKEKNKGKNKNKVSKPTQAKDGSFIPPALRVEPGQGVLLHFHTIVSPEFNYSPKKDKVVVVMDGVDFGSWHYYCVELKKERDLQKGYVQLSGSSRFQISCLKGKKIAYKYQIIKSSQPDNPIWDYIYKSNSYGTWWDHVLTIPDYCCVNGANWHHYDDVLQREIKGQHNQNTGVWKRVTSAWSSMTSTLGLSGKGDSNQVSRLVHDRQLAALTFLPKWEGFVVTQTPAKIEPAEAICMLDHICSTVIHPIVARGNVNYTSTWDPNGFDGPAFLMKYVSDKINSFGQGSDVDVVDDVEKRLISALAICKVIYQHDLRPNKQLWSNLFKGLRVPSNLQKPEYIKLAKSIKETYKSIWGEMIDAVEAVCSFAIKESKIENFLLTLPLLHLFREDIKPYEPALGKDYFSDRQWWGVHGLKVDHRFMSDCERQHLEIDHAHSQLLPLFEVDCLLQRSIIWLHLTPSGLLRYMEINRNQAPPKLICCALHLLLSANYISGEDIKKLQKCMELLQSQLSAINQSDGITMNAADCVELVAIAQTISLTAMKRCTGQVYSPFIAKSCKLFAASHSACSTAASTTGVTTRSNSEVQNNIHQQAQKVLTSLLDWLNKTLPRVVSYDGKWLEYKDEMTVWGQLLGITYIFKTDFGAAWKNQLIGSLHGRIEKLKDIAKVELFSNFDTPDLHIDVSNCLSDAAFSAIDSLVNETKARGMWDQIFNSSSTPAKYGDLLSKVLLKSWPEWEDEQSILQHLLNWAPFTNFFKITCDQKTAYGNILTEEAQYKLGIAQSVFDVIQESVLDGSIIIGRLKLIVKDKCCNQFIALSNQMAAMDKGKDVKERSSNVKIADIIALIAARRNELKAIENQYKLNNCLVAMCTKIEPVDFTKVEQSLRANINELQLSKVCHPATHQSLNKSPKGIPPDIYYFQHQSCVTAMLQPLLEIHDSRVFIKLWRKQAAKLRKPGQPERLSLSDVATKIWQPVYDVQLKDISVKLTYAHITLGDVDVYFKDLIEKGSILQDELRRLMSLQGDVDDGILAERLRQVKDYYHYKQQSSAAGEMLNIKDAFKLTGDFEPMETLSEVNSEEFKKQPLQAINKDVDYAAREMQAVNSDQIQCLKELAKCHELINWIRTEIKDERQLRVFVELAMNSAGETAMDVDKVTCFHRAVTGYASFIFDLDRTPNPGYKQLLDVSKKVWEALEKDENLSKELIDTQKELYWFRNVRNSQGDVETSSLMLAETINKWGIYNIGKLDPDKRCTELPVLLLKVNTSGEAGADDKKKQTYTIDELKDLQSKLTLVASKKRNQREGQNEVDYFVEVFTAAQQLAATYEKLTQAGNILYSDWKAMLYCGYQEGVSVHIDFGGYSTALSGKKNILTGTKSLLTELNFLRGFMNNCLQEWYQYVDEKRSECYNLNYFTTEQLVLLRRHLANFAISDDEDIVPPQVFVLLSAVTPWCNANDVRSALKEASKSIKNSSSGEAGVAEHQEAIRRVKALEIVEELNVEYGFDRKVAWAAIQDLGLDESSDVYMDWCVDHVQDDDKIDQLFEELQASEPYLFLDEESDDDDDMDFKSFSSMTQRLDEFTHSLLAKVTSQKKTLEKQLTGLWSEYLDSMKAFDVEDCLSLEHLGLVLHCLAEANPDHAERTFSSPLETGIPNLVVRAPGDVLITVLSLYMHEDGKLPSLQEVLVCSPDTSLEEVVLLWRRAIGDQLGRVFCLVRADLLNYDVSVKAEQELAKLMKGQSGYRLVIVCSSDKEDSSHIMTALDQYRREMPASSSRDSIREYLKDQFKMQADDVQNEEGVEAAASLTHHGCNVEVIVSSRPGVGKTLKVQRYKERLYQDGLCDDETKACVTIPLQESAVNKDAIIRALLPHQDESILSEARIYHLDVAPMVHEGLDHLLFNLLILGGLCDSHGHVWCCKPQDLYVIEITDFALQHRKKKVSRSHSFLPFYSVLPCVTCHAPQEVLSACQYEEEYDTLPQGWKDCDPKVDDKEFRGPAFQRAYQYLVRHSRGANLDAFLFKEKVEGDDKSFLTTLLNHCGVEDPSWSELRHFAHFLSIQLDDCQSSVFCNPDYHDVESGFGGFKTFVVKFMIKMAMDFATPSLNMSEENPSCAIGSKTPGEDEDEYDEDDLPQELEAFQLRRRWETSLHPYIFFNHDRVSMTFMGFYIDSNGSLKDPSTQLIIEANIMNRHLRQALQVNGVELSKDFDNLPRWKKLEQLGRVLGVEEITDSDGTYELTTDNVKKMLAIHMRFRCGIPVVIMGETGCGKTRLIRFLCRLQAAEDGLNNMILMKVHGGTTSNDIARKIEKAQEIARANKEDHDVDTVLFFDEANTTEAIGLIKEIMCDGRVKGQPIDMAEGALKIVAACNPYRRHTEAMIDRLKAAGLGYHVAASDTQEKLGTIPLRELVYRVQALPPSMLPLVWDFGQLNAAIEAKYIRQIVQRYVNTERLEASDHEARIITDVLSASQQFMRDQENECSFVSLRDVERCLEVLVWFYDHMDMLRPLLKAKAEERGKDEESESEEEDYFEDKEEEGLEDLTMSLVLAIGVCYHACLQEGREYYRDTVADAFDHPCDLPNGADQILEEITRCQDVFLDQVMNLDDNIARNAALRENVFMMVICIELRIPLFLVGKPGSSKSLAKTIVADAMQGEAARSSHLFKHLKQVHMSSYQCSPLSTPDGIVGIFRQCSKFQEGKDLDKFVSCVVLDEVGLAEDSPRMPLKTLHPLLETGSEEDEDEPVPHKKVAFIGLSNWALDPAKMNRGILVSREEPNLKELIETAEGICSTDLDVLEHVDRLIPSLAKAYLEIYNDQERQYFGLRDYYSLIKMVFHTTKQSNYSPTWGQIEHSVRRNFGGLPNTEDQVEVFKKQDTLSVLANMAPRDDEPDCSPAGLLKASLDRDATGHGETRYLLILTENYAALPIVQQQLLHQQDAITIYGSSFPYDQEYTQVCRNINRIKVCMETGRTVVLLNLENLYESLYDALNQYYVYFGGQRYVDLGLGTHKVKCRVDKDFRLIVIADKDVVYERFPTPLINRLEKHFLATSTMLTEAQHHLLKELEQWVQRFSSINILHQHHKQHTFEVSDAFVGFHGDTLASLVFQVCKEINQTDGNQEWKDLVIHRVKILLLQCATPDSVMRLNESKLLKSEVEQIKDDYFSQEHSSLEGYLQQCLLQVNQEAKDFMAYVTTHSRLLGNRDCDQLKGALHIPVNIIFLQNFHTEQQFCSEVREFFIRCKENPGLLLIQCDDGHLNNQLIACASYCVQDEKTQAKELHATMKPAHVVFVIQLAMEGRGYTGFRGTGIWRSFHIDDLQPAQSNRPEIANLRGLSIKNLFERDPSLHPTQQNAREETDPVEDVVAGTGDEIEQEDEMNVDRIRGTESEKQSASQTKQPTMPHRQRNFTVMNSNNLVVSEVASASEDQSAMDEVGPLVIDVTRLLQDSILSAASRISDSESRAKRTTQRIALLNQLFVETESTEGVLDFLHVIKHRLFHLISEREERGSGLVDAWLSTEALRVADVQKSGTFRKAIWQRLIAIISPLLAELIAFCDCSDNLNLLLEHGKGHWQHQLWLAIISHPNVSVLQYEDFQSPINNILREKALVRVVGSSDKPITANLPFSWLLKEFMETMHEQALDLKAINQSSDLETIYQNLVIKSPWHALLCQHVPAEVQEDFIQKYLMDFIRMKYKTNFGKENVESELECVYQALEITTQLTRRQLEPLEGSNKITQLLVSIHLSYSHIQGRLSHFGRLVELYPALLDESNVEKLTKQEGQMTLDGTAIHMTVDSLVPESRCWKDRTYQQRWFTKVEAAKPIIESTIQTVMHGSTEVYGEATLQRVQNARKVWEKICVLRLFLEHICPVNVDAEVVLSNQGWMLWKKLTNNQNGMKSLEGLKVVENILTVCCNKASKEHFKMGVDDCPLCSKADISQPVVLPCGKICCKDCLVNWFRNSGGRSCPACKETVAEDYPLEVTTENREAIWKYNSFRQRCNAFFMDVVSQLCFGNGTPPNCDVVDRLMTYVTRETEMKDKKLMQTKRLTAFQGDGIDPSPVIRSVLLQLLLQSNVTEVQKYMSQYLEQAHDVLVQHKTQDIIEVCMLFIQCLEDSFHRRAAKHSDPTHGLVDMATEKLQEANQWLEEKEPDEDVTIDYLIAIASARFGLVTAAKYLYDVYCQKDSGLSIKQVNSLLDAAHELCEVEGNNEVHLFLVRHLCHCYGTNTMETLSQQRHLRWVTLEELISQNEECPDRFVVCGGAYCSIREAMAQAAITGHYNGLDKALKGCSQQPPRQREVVFMLSLYREITMTYGSQQDEEITQKVKEDMKSYIENHDVVTQKELAASLIDNQYMSGVCNQLVTSPVQSIFHQSLVAMVMHTIITFNCGQGNSVVNPLVNLLQNPNLMKNSYLPTMPEDHRMEAKKAIDDAAIAAKKGETYAWYVCPNGHLYTIGDCGRPYYKGQCKECGANIGGARHELTEGNKKAEMADTTSYGHILGDANGRQARPIAERHISPLPLAIIRVIMHSAMIGAAVTNPQDVKALIVSQPEAVGQFLWQHIEADMQLMSASCGKSLDDCLFIIHLVLHRIATKKPSNQSKGTMWDHLLKSKESRALWEAAFTKAYVTPIIEHLEDKVRSANETLQSDKRFSTNPLMHILYKSQPTSAITEPQDMCKLHTFPDVWQYRPQITIESLLQYVDRQPNVQDDNNGHTFFALLREFLAKDHILSMVAHLPDLVRLQQVLIDQYHRRIDAAEATKITIEEFLNKSQPDVQQLVHIFIKVWNQVREYIPSYGGIVVPRDLCSQVLDTSYSIAMMLPTRREAGVCSTAVVDFLIGTHNEMVQFYQGITKNTRCDPIQPSDATLNHLVAYDKDKDLLPLVLSHRDYAMKAGQGTTDTFNLPALQRQIEDRFLRGRPEIIRKIEQLVFRQDSYDAVVFQTLRNRIPQKSLPPSVQHQILSQLKSLADLSDCLAVLVIAIGFLVSSPCQPDMRISKYLHTTLSLPAEKGIQASQKAHEYCRVHHILSLWQTLAVEQACRNKQDPFDDVGQEYRVDVDDTQKANLQQALRHMNVEQLIAELYEYITLNLKRSNHQELHDVTWRIIDAVEAYMDIKYGDIVESMPEETDAAEIHGLDRYFPGDLQLQHAVNTWKAVVKFSKQQQQ